MATTKMFQNEQVLLCVPRCSSFTRERYPVLDTSVADGASTGYGQAGRGDNIAENGKGFDKHKQNWGPKEAVLNPNKALIHA